MEILIVEPDELTLNPLRDRLRKWGYKVPIAVNTGKQAIIIAKKHQPDLVLMAIDLDGGMDGIEAATVINDILDIPVIYITDPLSDSQGKRMLESSSYAYIKKPIDYEVLRVNVEMVFQRSKFEQQIRESEQKFFSIVEMAHDAIVIIDGLGNITYWNIASEQIFGYTAEEATGLDVHILLNPNYDKDKQTAEEGLRKFQQTGLGNVVNKTLTLTARKKNGKNITVELSVSSIIIDRKFHAIAIIRDITEREMIQHELAKTSKLESLGVFAGGISNEYQHILTKILDQITFAKLSLDPGAKSRKSIDIIEQEVLKAKELTHKLVSLSYGNNVNLQYCNLIPLVKECAKDALKGSDIQYEYFLEENLWNLTIDEKQICRAVTNVLSNAKEAVEESGKKGIISIKCDNITYKKSKEIPKLPDRDYVRISIEDNGPGISKNVISRVFDPYYSTKPNSEGTGLSVAYSIIKKHKGYIGVESTEGNGAAFNIYIPRDNKYF